MAITDFGALRAHHQPPYKAQTSRRHYKLARLFGFRPCFVSCLFGFVTPKTGGVPIRGGEFSIGAGGEGGLNPRRFPCTSDGEIMNRESRITHARRVSSSPCLDRDLNRSPLPCQALAQHRTNSSACAPLGSATTCTGVSFSSASRAPPPCLRSSTRPRRPRSRWRRWPRPRPRSPRAWLR